MGEIAEMMLDGTLCASCGSYLEGGGDGTPKYCSPQCRQDAGIDAPRMPCANRAVCPVCRKQFPSRKARRQHQRDKHETATRTEDPSHDRD